MSSDSDFFKGVPIELITESRGANVDLVVEGKPEKVVDFIFLTRTQTGGQRLKKSPRYRFPATKIRQLIGYLEEHLAVIEGRTPPSVERGARH